MTDNKDLKYTQTFKEPTYKTCEQFVLEKQSEQDRKVADSYAQEIEAYSDISSPKGYGPCKNSLCGCSCSSYSCVCGGVRIQVKDTGASLSVSGRAKNTNSPFGKAGGQVSGSAFGYKDDDGELKIGSGTIGGEISSRSVKCKVSADLYNVKHDGIQARVGISADTGISIENGFEAKAFGTGFSVDENQVGISTPFFEFKFNYR